MKWPEGEFDPQMGSDSAARWGHSQETSDGSPGGHSGVVILVVNLVVSVTVNLVVILMVPSGHSGGKSNGHSGGQSNGPCDGQPRVPSGGLTVGLPGVRSVDLPFCYSGPCFGSRSCGYSESHPGGLVTLEQ